MKLYFASMIRGKDGDSTLPEVQRQNIDKACQLAYVLQEHFPEIDWVVPHANEIVNRLYFGGYVEGDDVVEVECDLIRDGDIDGVVVVGKFYAGTGVAKEATTAYDAGKFLCYLDDVSEESRILLASELARWETDE